MAGLDISKLDLVLTGFSSSGLVFKAELGGAVVATAVVNKNSMYGVPFWHCQLDTGTISSEFKFPAEFSLAEFVSAVSHRYHYLTK